MTLHRRTLRRRCDPSTTDNSAGTNSVAATRLPRRFAPRNELGKALANFAWIFRRHWIRLDPDLSRKGVGDVGAHAYPVCHREERRDVAISLLKETAVALTRLPGFARTGLCTKLGVMDELTPTGLRLQSRIFPMSRVETQHPQNPCLTLCSTQGHPPRHQSNVQSPVAMTVRMKLGTCKETAGFAVASAPLMDPFDPIYPCLSTQISLAAPRDGRSGLGPPEPGGGATKFAVTLTFTAPAGSIDGS